MKFKTICADPPWKYDNQRTGGSMKSGAVQKYPVMDLAQIKALPVSNIADKDCILFLWGTVPLLPWAFEVMDAWGFKYKTCLFWNKIGRRGLGFWFRGQVEVCLLGIRGKVTPFRCQLPNVIEAPISKHSQKPVDFFHLVEPYTPEPRLEMFARTSRLGWYCWGNEVESDFQLLGKND